MAKHPIANLDEVEFDDIEDNGFYTSRRALFSDSIGATRLGYNLTLLPPGKAQCPFHNHHGEEEMFLIIACPTGGAEVAHQIINTGSITMRYLAVSSVVDIETCEYPDSGKIMISAGRRGDAGVRKIFRAEQTVDYYDRENTEPPTGA